MITNSNIVKNEPVPPLVKVTAVAKFLSVSRCTVHSLIESGHLKASEINAASKERKHLRVTRESLLGFYRKRFGHSLTRALANHFEP
jgi:hypothetical protein